MHGEACGFEESAVDGWGWVEGFGCGFGVDVEGCEGGLECGADGGDVALASHLGYETTAWLEGAIDAVEGERLLRGREPVECGVGEDGVELVFIGKVGGVVVVDVEIALAGCGDHGGGAVGSGDYCSGSGEFFGEGSVAAAEVEDGFAGLRGEKVDYS